VAWKSLANDDVSYVLAAGILTCVYFLSAAVLWISIWLVNHANGRPSTSRTLSGSFILLASGLVIGWQLGRGPLGSVATFLASVFVIAALFRLGIWRSLGTALLFTVGILALGFAVGLALPK
jgi:hypothetical protein